MGRGRADSRAAPANQVSLTTHLLMQRLCSCFQGDSILNIQKHKVQKLKYTLSTKTSGSEPSPTPSFRVSRPGWGGRTAFLSSSQITLMQLVQGPYLENHYVNIRNINIEVDTSR